jgi:hypothetical protein
MIMVFFRAPEDFPRSPPLVGSTLPAILWLTPFNFELIFKLKARQLVPIRVF